MTSSGPGRDPQLRRIRRERRREDRAYERGVRIGREAERLGITELEAVIHDILDQADRDD